MLLLSLIVWFLLAAAPRDVVGADRPRQTFKTNATCTETT